MIKQYQNSVIAQLLQAIIGQINFDGEPISNIGDILLSILEQTPYDKEPKSVLAELFLKLKAKIENEPFTPYDKAPQSALAEILLSILNETEYDKEPNSRIAELLLELKEELESYAELTASGAIANFTTSVVKPLVNLTAYFNATQEAGTPTPSTPIPIVGVSAVNVTACGVNVFDGVWELGNIGTSGGGNVPSTTRIRSKNYMAVKPNTTIYIKSDINLQLFFYGSDKSYITYSGSFKNQTFNLGSNVYYIRFKSDEGVRSDNNSTSINYPSTDTDYHTYNGSTTLINLGGTYYGGYVTQDKNGKRELVVTHAIHSFDGTETFTSASNNRFFYTANADIIQPTVSTEDLVKSSHFASSNQGAQADKSVWKTTANRIVGFRDSSIADISAWQSFVLAQYNANTPLQIVYKLATPIVIDLPDGEPITAFNGVNNVYNDSGDTSVTYLAKIEDNLNATAKFRAEVKALKEKEKEDIKEDVKDDVKEDIKDLEPVKDSGEKKR